MLDHDVQVRALISETNDWVDTATFPGASDQQILDLVNAFERRAGRPLADDEIDALFQLQHGLVAKRAFIEGVLSGRLKVDGQNDRGEFLFDVPR